MNRLFFELIRVAIGTQDDLSHAPSHNEWRKLYALAEKQAVVGVCFVGVQQLKKLGYDISADVYMKWLAMAAKIQQRNELMNRRCLELQRMLEKEGIKSSILKGQGVARLYRMRSEELGMRSDSQLGFYRQCGDIDVYVPCGMERGLRWCRERYGDLDFDYINAHVPMFKDVDVELHWRIGSMTNLFRNRRLQQWLEREETKEMILGGKTELKPETSLNPETPLNPETHLNPETTLSVPTLEFNAFYLMLHCYNHIFSSGLGLRQFMDYYFLLMARDNLNLDVNLNKRFKEFGMERFVGAVMWIMQEVFGLERECMLCDPYEKEGRFVLAEVMDSGNFGHHDKRIRKVGKGKWQSVFANLQHALHMLRRYPSEALWMPVWMVYHFVWKRTLKIK